MRLGTKLSAVTLGLAGLALSAAGGSAGAVSPPGSGYAWAQPGAAPVNVAHTQLPAWIPLVPVVCGTPARSAYVWVQPGTAVANVPEVQPLAWMLAV